MTIFLVAGTMMILSVIAGLPEIYEKMDKHFFTFGREVTKVRVETQAEIDFVEGIELYGEFWFEREAVVPRPIWRQKNAKCAWKPMPPVGRKMFSDVSNLVQLLKSHELAWG